MKAGVYILAIFAAVSGYAQQPMSPQMEVANLREDLRGLMQRVDSLSLKVEELERENAQLKEKSGTAEKSYATLKQLDAAIADVNAKLKTTVAASQADTMQQATAMMEKLGKQTNAALDSLAKGMATRPPVQTVFTDNYSKEGLNYTVQQGDSLGTIAKKTGAKAQDIINANKLPDGGNKIQPGQSLFIPGGK